MLWLTWTVSILLLLVYAIGMIGNALSIQKADTKAELKRGWVYLTTNAVVFFAVLYLVHQALNL